MTSRSGALVAPPSWGRARDAEAEEPARRAAPRRARRAHPRVRWGIRGGAGADLAGGAALLAATAGLWTAFLLAVW